MKLLVHLKLIIRNFFSIEAFCKECGRTVHDFIAPDEVWEQIDKNIKYGHVLCYDCFCEKCHELDLKCVWELK